MDRIILSDGVGRSAFGEAALVPARQAQVPAKRRLVSAAAQRPRNIAVLGAALALMMAAGILGLPLLASCVLGVGSAAYSIMVARDASAPDFARRLYGRLGPPLRPDVRPDDLTPPEISASYIAILRGHEQIRTALNESEGLIDGLTDVYTRCSELVQAAGRVARGGNHLRSYIENLSPDTLQQDAARLEARADATRDPHAARAFRRAAVARKQQLSIYRQIEGLYDRVVGRLQAVTSFLGAVEALIIKLHALDLEQLGATGDTLSQHLDDLRTELELLESSLESALTDD